MNLRDLVLHLERDCPVGRMPLASRAKLDQVDRLTRIEVEHVTQPVCERHGIRRIVDKSLTAQPLPLATADLEPFAEAIAEAGILDFFRDLGAEVAAQPLPLAG